MLLITHKNLHVEKYSMNIIHWLLLISHHPQLLCLILISLSCPALCASFQPFYCSEKAGACNIIKDKKDCILSHQGTGSQSQLHLSTGHCVISEGAHKEAPLLSPSAVSQQLNIVQVYQPNDHTLRKSPLWNTNKCHDKQRHTFSQQQSVKSNLSTVDIQIPCLLKDITISVTALLLLLESATSIFVIFCANTFAKVVRLRKS